MMKVTSLANMPERDLNRWIRRIAAILVVGLIAFGAFYFIDRYRDPGQPMIDRQLAALEEAVRTNPEDIASRGQLADTYFAKGMYKDALAQYTLILQTGKADELALFGRARAHLLNGSLNAAAADYQSVVDIAEGGEMANVDPMLQAAYYGLGQIAMEQDKPADAVTHLENALRIKRSDADALLLIGKAYFANGQPDEAAAALKAAVSYVPVGWAEPYQILADGYTKAGMTDLAAWANAMVDFQTGDTEEAEKGLLALTDGEAKLDAAVGLGLLHETRGDLASASEWYQRALAIDPENAGARLGIGRTGTPEQYASPLPELPAPGQGEGGDG